MRTKTTLAAAALLAAGFASSMAQNVYSLNVVGYVNVPVVANKIQIVSNPLLPNGGNYSLNNTVIMPDSGADALLYKWAGTAYNSTVPQYFDSTTKWDTVGDTFTLDPGTSVLILGGGANSTITFVGEVRQGAASSSTIPVNNSLRASMIPVAERQPGAGVGNPDDLILTWNQTAQSWDANAWIKIVDPNPANTGWYDSVGAPSTFNGPLLDVATGFFYENAGAPVVWNRNFTVQ